MEEKEKSTVQSEQEDVVAEVKQTEVSSEHGETVNFKKMGKSGLVEFCEALVKENDALISANKELSDKYDDLSAKVTDNEAAKRDADEYKNRLITMKGDFDRYKARNQAAIEEATAVGKNHAIEKVFTVLDTFDRAKETVKDEATLSVLALINKQFDKVLADLGVEEIQVLDEEFDPTIANAVLKQKVKDKKKKNTVIAVVSKGYKLNGKILKYPQVVVGQ
ncbi:MAG: nucleotide exchange factor GrpE [Clostridia bacterium]|nr:nucleotide exchange factor GrpE [Clostridia bacterium]